jgi:hypothetical protein
MQRARRCKGGGDRQLDSSCVQQAKWSTTERSQGAVSAGGMSGARRDGRRQMATGLLAKSVM